MSEDTASRKPSHVAFQVSNGKDGQAYFNRIGAAFPHRDGHGIDVVLHSLPVDGRITLRTAQERLEELRNGELGQRAEHDRDRG